MGEMHIKSESVISVHENYKLKDSNTFILHFTKKQSQHILTLKGI